MTATAVTARTMIWSQSRGGTGTHTSYGTSRVSGWPSMVTVSCRYRVTLW